MVERKRSKAMQVAIATELSHNRIFFDMQLSADQRSNRHGPVGMRSRPELPDSSSITAWSTPMACVGTPPKKRHIHPHLFSIRGAHTKRKFKYGKERSPRGLECECTQKERSTSITKQLVFQYPFCRETSCNRVLERFLLVE